MERIDLENWFAQHPESIHFEWTPLPSREPRTLLDECEADIRAHAHHDAWIYAKDIAEQSLRRFERSFGLPASDTFVTREVCHELARELEHHEPHPFGQEPHGLDVGEWVSQSLLDALDPEPRQMLREWVSELAAKHEHAAWREIVYFTDHLGKKLIEEGQMTSRVTWDRERTYPRVAARVARMILREFDIHAGVGLEPRERPGARETRGACVLSR